MEILSTWLVKYWWISATNPVQIVSRYGTILEGSKGEFSLAHVRFRLGICQVTQRGIPAGTEILPSGLNTYKISVLNVLVHSLRFRKGILAGWANSPQPEAAHTGGGGRSGELSERGVYPPSP